LTPCAFVSRMSTARLIASRTSFVGSAPVHSCQRGSSHLQPFMYSGVLAVSWSLTAPDSHRGLDLADPVRVPPSPGGLRTDRHFGAGVDQGRVSSTLQNRPEPGSGGSKEERYL
jgi:hypothetical protein